MTPQRAALVFPRRSDSKVLLGQKLTGEIGLGTLNGPGGKLNPGESPISGALREMFEEVGIAARPEDLVHCALLICYAEELGPSPYQIVYTYQMFNCQDIPLATESMEPHWYSCNAIPYEWMLESDSYWFPKLLMGETFTAHIYYRKKAQGFIRIQYYPFNG